MKEPPFSRKRSSNWKEAWRSTLLPIESVPRHSALTSKPEFPSVIFLMSAPPAQNRLSAASLTVSGEHNAANHNQNAQHFGCANWLHRRAQPAEVGKQQSADHLT